MIPSTPHSRKRAISRGSFTVQALTFTPAACAAFTSSGVRYVRLGCRAQRRLPRASAFSIGSMVFSGECPLAPRWPIRRMALASHIPATHSDERHGGPGEADRDQRGETAPIVL